MRWGKVISKVRRMVVAASRDSCTSNDWTVDGVPIVIVVVLLVTCNLVTSVSVTSSVVTFAWHGCRVKRVVGDCSRVL